MSREKETWEKEIENFLTKPSKEKILENEREINPGSILKSSTQMRNVQNTKVRTSPYFGDPQNLRPKIKKAELPSEAENLRRKPEMLQELSREISREVKSSDQKMVYEILQEILRRLERIETKLDRENSDVIIRDPSRVAPDIIIRDFGAKTDSRKSDFITDPLFSLPLPSLPLPPTSREFVPFCNDTKLVAPENQCIMSGQHFKFVVFLVGYSGNGIKIFPMGQTRTETVPKSDKVLVDFADFTKTCFGKAECDVKVLDGILTLTVSKLNPDIKSVELAKAAHPFRFSYEGTI